MGKNNVILIKEHLQGKILLRTARIKMQLGDNDNALNDLKHANNIFLENNIQSDLSTSYILSGLHYYNQGNLEKAEEYYKKTLKIKKAINDLSGIAAAYANLGNIYFYKFNNRMALKYYEYAKTIYKSLNQNIKETSVIISINSIFLRKKLYKKIVETEYLENILKKNKLNLLLIYFYQGLSDAYYHLGNTDKAYSILKKGIRASSILLAEKMPNR